MRVQTIHIHDFERTGVNQDIIKYACDCGAIKEEFYQKYSFVYWIQEADGTVIRGERDLYS